MEIYQLAPKCSTTLTTQSREVEYPAKCKSGTAREKHKEKTLQENPEILFIDYVQQIGGRKKNNILFFTDSIYIWKDTLCNNYTHVSSEGIGSGGRLKICKDEHLDKDDPLLTITYYTKGKVMIQGNEANLESFEEAFPLLKAEVATKKTNISSDSEDESPEENPTNFSISAPPTPASSTNQFKESMALLELDFAEFKELTQARLSNLPDINIQQLKEELQQLKRDNQASAADFTGSLEKLRQENCVLRAQLTHLGEGAEKRERSFIREVQHLTDRLSLIPTTASTETQTLPASVPSPCLDSVPSSLDSTQYDSTLTPDASTSSAASDQPCPSQLTFTPEEQAPQVVLLADSNGKFLDTSRLFPGRKVLSKRCSTTGQAIKLLKKETLGSPQCLVIHTGTNDVHSLRKDTAGAMKKMAEQASMEFPDTRIVVSTLLPRTDTPPHVIHDINMEVRRGCSTLPNVHLAFHPTIGTWDLYDGLHLHKEKVGIFAKTLKDAALGRSPSITSPTGSFRDHPPPTHHHPRLIPPAARRHNNPAWTSHSPRTHHLTTVRHNQRRPPSPSPTSAHQRPPHPQQQSYAAAPCPPLHPQQRSYAAAVAQAAAKAPSPATSELGDIREMLHTLCTRLLSS